MRWLLPLWVVVVVELACTKANPHSCSDGLCTDQAFPFCDIDGVFGGAENECIAVSCTPGELAGCRVDQEVRCNSTGNDYELVQCTEMCDPTMDGCVDARVPFITFVSDRDGNNEIYRMQLDGTLQTNITNDSASDDKPAWSPDGDRIAFRSNRNGQFEVFTMDVDGANVVDVSLGEADAFSWSPDSQRLSFVSSRSGMTELYTARSDGLQAPTKVTSLGNVANSDWAPDGSRITFESAGQVYVMNADGTNPNAIAVGQFPKWRPDGSKIAFRRRITFNDYDYFTVNPDGTQPLDLSLGATLSLLDGVWSPNGGFLLGTSGLDEIPPNASDEIYTLNVATKIVANLSNSPGGRNIEPCWSPDGETVVFTSARDGNDELYTIPRAGGPAANLTRSNANDTSCAWRPR